MLVMKSRTGDGTHVYAYETAEKPSDILSLHTIATTDRLDLVLLLLRRPFGELQLTKHSLGEMRRVREERAFDRRLPDVWRRD